jgi:hypothetical protein
MRIAMFMGALGFDELEGIILDGAAALGQGSELPFHSVADRIALSDARVRATVSYAFIAALLIVNLGGLGANRQGKHFFFEKKKQKTFDYEGSAVRTYVNP